MNLFQHCALPARDEFCKFGINLRTIPWVATH